jgi:hypothetical protein
MSEPVNRRNASVNTRGLGRYAVFALGLTPLIPGWLAALFVWREQPLWQPTLVGAVIVGSAVVVGLPVWEALVRLGTLVSSRRNAILGHAIACVTFVSLWLWLQYALHPFRERPILEALAQSSSAPWQVVTGLFVYGGLLLSSRMWIRRSQKQGPSGSASGWTGYADFIPVNFSGRTTVVPVSGVERFQGWDDHVAVYVDGRRLLASERLSDLASRLDPARFLRIHRSHLVNLAHVTEVRALDRNRVVVHMRSGDKVAASRRGTLKLRERLRQEMR